MSAGGAPSLVLRRAEPADAPTILALEEAIFPEDPWTAAMIGEELASPHSDYLLACEGDEDGPAIGYAGVKTVADGADIMTIGVLPAARGAGLGRALLDELLALASARGASAVFLEVRESNAAARALYAAAGFDEIGRIARYFRNPLEDAIGMRLLLPEGSR